MLVQVRADALRLVRQHDHGLLAGALAGAWRRGDDGGGLSPTTVLAASLHDVVWRDEDRHPRLNAASGRPHDFSTLPAALKEPLVEDGLVRLDAVVPDAAALVREHHHALRDGRAARGEAAWVRYFDGLSLLLCLTGPGADARHVPPWLGPGLLAPPDGRPAPEARWAGPATLVLTPFPFAGASLPLGLPHRDIPLGPYRDPAELAAAWNGAETRTAPLLLTG